MITQRYYITPMMPIQIAYYYRKEGLEATRHDQICELLSRLQEGGRISAVVVEDADAAFPTEQAKRELFDRLRHFAMCRKAGLGKIFGREMRDTEDYLPASPTPNITAYTQIRTANRSRHLEISQSVGIELRRACCRWRVTSLALSIARWDLISTMATFPCSPTPSQEVPASTTAMPRDASH
jgi:hypothetical protein